MLRWPRARMELVNQTPVVAGVRVATLEGTPHRYGLLIGMHYSGEEYD